MNLNELIDYLLQFVGNDDNFLKLENKNEFRGLLLYLIKLERNFKGYCSNINCRCQTKNIIKEYLKNEKLVEFINGYNILLDKEILNLMGE